MIFTTKKTGKDNNERIEIRTKGYTANILVKVYKKPNVLDWSKYWQTSKLSKDYYKNNHNKIQLSMNGTLDISKEGFDKLVDVIKKTIKEINY